MGYCFIILFDKAWHNDNEDQRGKNFICLKCLVSNLIDSNLAFLIAHSTIIRMPICTTKADNEFDMKNYAVILSYTYLDWYEFRL